MEEKDFNFNKFWGDERIKGHLEFRRNSYMKCVYCGEIADTREHCPSRTFLKAPRPTDLPTVPACSKCNNSYSSDENYTSAILNILYSYYNENNKDIIKENIKDTLEVKKAKEKVNKLLTENIWEFDDRMARVFNKLAICHATYELSEGYYSDSWNGKPEVITYVLRPHITEQMWEELEYAEVINNDLLPEIGSRVFRNIYVVESFLENISSGNNNKIHLCMMDWTDIQSGYYKYLAFIRGNNLYVKMIFRDFLYAEVVFKNSDK